MGTPKAPIAKRRTGKPAPLRLDVLTIPPPFELQRSYWATFGRPDRRKERAA